MDDKNIKGVYNTLKKEGYNPPEYDTFRKDMQDDKNLQGVYNSLKKEGYTPPEYKVFKQDMFGSVQQPGSVSQQVVSEYDKSAGDTPVVPWQQPQNYVEQLPALGVSSTQHLTDAAIAANNAILNDNKAEPVKDERGRPYYPVKPKAVMEDEIRKEYQVEPVESQIDKAITANEEAIRRIEQGKKQTYDKHAEEHPYLHTFGGFARQHEGRVPDVNPSDDKEMLRNLYAERNKLEEAKKVINASRTNGVFSNIASGAKDAITSPGFWDFGMSGMSDNSQLVSIKNKLDNKQPLTEDEQRLLNAAALAQDVSSVHQDRISPWYTAGQTTTNMLPFMAEMALNPAAGLGKAAQKAMTNKIAGAVGKSLTKKILPKLVRAVGDVAGASAMTVTTGAMRTIADADRRMLGNVDANIEDGKIVGEGFSDGLGKSEALGKAFAANTIENWSEMLGEYFAPALKGIGNVTGKGMRKIGMGKVTDFISGVNSTTFAKGVDDFLERTQWHGPIGEIAEEEAGIIANSYITGDNKLSDLTDPKQQLDIVLGVGLFGGFVSGLKTLGYKTPSKRAERDLRKSEKNASKKFSNWDELKINIDNAEDENFSGILDGIINSDVVGNDSKKKAAIIDYAYSLQRWRGVNAAKLKQSVETPEIIQELTESKEETLVGVTPEDIEANKVDIYRDYKRAERKVNSILPEELTSQLDAVSDLGQFASANNLNEQQVSVLADYLPAKEMYLQYVSHTDRRREEAKAQAREQAIADVERISNPETGLVVQAKHKFADNPVYLVGGNLSFGEDGFLDRDSSSETIYYVDENGERKMAQAEDFDSVLSEVPIDDMIVQAEANAEQDFITNEEESLRSPDIPAPERGVTVNIGGDTYVIENPDDDIPGNYSAAKLDANGEIDTHGNITSLSPDEYYAAKEAELWKVAEQTTQNVHKSDNMSEKYLESATDTPIRESKVSEDVPTDEQSQETPEQKMQRVIASLPKKKNGKIDYKALTPQQQYEYTSITENEETAASDLKEEISAREEELKKMSERLAKVTGSKRAEARDAIRERKVVLDELQSFYNTIVPPIVETQEEKLSENTVPEDLRTDEDYINWISENSEDAKELLDAYSAAKELASHEQTLKPWQKELLGRKIRPDSFNRFGDRNHVTGGLAKAWLKKDGEELDTLSQELSTFGAEVTEQDIIDFMMGNPGNRVSQVSNDMRNLSKRFSEIATKEMGIPVSGPESNTGKLYIRLKEANQKLAELSEQQKIEIQGALSADMEASDEQRTDWYSESLNDYATQYDQFRNEMDEEAADEVIIREIEASKPELYHGGFTADELDDIYSQIENNNGTERQTEDSRENQSPLSGEKVEQHEESGAPKVATTENRESEGQYSEVEPIEQLENAEEQKRLNAEQSTKSVLPIVEPSSLTQENGDIALKSEDNSVPLQGDNQKVNKNDEVSESIPQGEHGTLPEISGEQEEPGYQLRRGIEAASRNASESEGSRDDQQEIKPIGVGPFGAIYNQSNKEAATSIDKKTDTGENQIDLQSDTALLQDVGSSSVDRDSELSVNKQKNPRFTAPQPEAGEDLIDYVSRTSEAKRLFDAEQEVDTTPTEAQKSAGNYKKGHINIGGYDITIENPKGSERSGVDTNGQPWSVTMNNSYGYIRGTEGVDGDHIDVFLSDNPADGKVYVIDQMNEDGFFDEHKVMYGFPSAETARAAYLANYSSGWKGLGTITEVSKDEFKKWIKSSHRKTKSFVDYKSVKADSLSPQENSSETTVNLPKSKSDIKNKKRAVDIKRARYELMDAKREFSVAQSTNSGYTPEEVEEKKKRVEEAENELKKLTNKVSNDGIRFREVEDKDGSKSLVGIHNIGEEKLRKALKLGGLANPSAAVIDISKQSHEGYGEISLVLPSSMVEKRTGRNAGTWSQDAWTPTYPQVERQFSGKGGDLFAENMMKLPQEMQSVTRQGMDNYMSGRDTDNLSYMFLHEQGKAPDLMRVPPKYSDEVYNTVREATNGTFSLTKLPDEALSRAKDIYLRQNGMNAEDYAESMKTRKTTLEENLQKISPKSFRYEKYKDTVEYIDKYGFDYGAVSAFVQDVERDAKIAGRPDERGTMREARKYIEDHGLQNEFSKWLESINDKYGIKEVIFDGFTPTGIRRYIPNTLENVSKFMKREGRNAATGIGVSFQNFAAGLLKEHGSLKDIRTEKGKLTNDYADVDAFRDKWSEVFYDLGEKLQPDAKGYDDYGLSRLAEAARTRNPKKYIKDEYGIEFSDEDARRLNEMIDAIRNEYPAMYFETKFERPVYLEEFAAAVVPERTSREIIDAMDKAGLRVFTYKDGDAASRNEAVKKASEIDGVRFRKIDGVNRKFNEELQQQIDGTLAEGHVYQLGNSNKELLSAGIPEQGKIVSSVEELSSRLNTPVHIARSLDELPDGAAKRAISSGRGIKAWIDVNTRKVVLYFPNAISVDDARRSVLHEVVGHKGLRGIFGDGKVYDSMMEQLYKQLPESEQKAVEASAVKDYKGSIAIAMDEYLAEQAENDITPSWWNRVVSAMRDFFREMGLDVTLTANDVKYLLWKSKNRLMNTDDSIAVINKIAADEGMKERFHIGEYSRTSEQEKADYERASKVVSDFAQSHAGAGNALVIRSRDMMRKQLEAKRVSVEDIDKYEKWFDEGETVAFWSPKYKTMFVLDTRASEEEINGYLWHENAHRALYDLDDYNDTVSIISNYVEDEFPELYSYVADMYKEDGGYTIREECVSHLLEYMSRKGRDKMDTGYIKLDKGPVRDTIGNLLDIINYGKRDKDDQDGLREDIREREGRGSESSYTERPDDGNTEGGIDGTGEEGGLWGRTLGAGHELEVRNSDASGFKEENRGKASEGTESSGRETGQEPEVIRFRDTTDEEQSDGTREAYEEAINTKGRWGKARLSQYNFQEAFQDEMLSVKILQEIIEEHSGKKLKGYENAYLAENRLGSTNLQERNKFVEEFYEPMMKIMDGLIKEGVSEKEIKDYLIAKSGLERNREFAVRDAIAAKEKDDGKKSAQELREKYEGSRDILRKQYADGKVEWDDYQGKLDELAALYAHKFRDYSGLTAITGDKEGFTDKAKDIVRQFETTHDVKPLWNSINAATKATLKKSYDSGITSKATYDHVAGMFEYYIPMRGWAEDTAEDVYDYINQGGGAFSATIKAAGGHEHESYDPFAAIGNMAESAILQGNRNLIKQKFMNMVLNHPSDVAKLSQVWYKKKDDGKWEASFPEIAEDATPDKVAKAIEDHQKEMLDLEKDGKAECRSNKLDVNYHIDPKNISQHAVVVKRNGVDFVIYINGNPRAAEALNGKLKMEQGGGWNFYDYLKRLYSAGMTSYNVNFVGANVSRDVHHAFFITYMEKGVKEAAKLAANGGTAFKTVYRGVSGKLDLNRKADVYYKEFLENGGETGYSNLNSMEAWKEDNDKRIARLKGIAKKAGYAKLGLERLGEWFEFANRIAENATRFNAYMLARENGKGVFDAVNEAKNITVNFNKKGSAQTPGFFGIAANIFRRWVLFANPIIQGLYQMYNVGKQHKVRFASAFAFHAALGFMLPVLNTFLVGMYGDDDDDYFNQNDYTRRNNLMLYIPKLGYLKLPLAPVFRNMYAMGDILYMKLNDLSTTEDLFWDSINEARAMLSIEGQSGRKEWSPSRFLLPDLVGPIVDVTENENFAGAPIYKDTEFNKFDPEFKKVYKDAWGSLTELSRVMNSFDGGNDYRKADHIGKWLNPAAMQHLITNYTGGVGQLIGDASSMLLDAFNGDMKENFSMMKVPVAKRFFTIPDERTSGSAIRKKYFRIKEEMDKLNHEVKERAKDAGGDLKKLRELSRLQNSKEYDWLLEFKAYSRRMNRMNNPQEKIELMQEVVDWYKEKTKGK